MGEKLSCVSVVFASDSDNMLVKVNGDFDIVLVILASLIDILVR
jgi:hypothetical protein